MSSTKNNIFRFKHFAVDQTGCGMKVNTDGVLLGALAEFDNPCSILDIGTGTGVIAMMLAQRFQNAHIDALEIDFPAAETAGKNFEQSGFSTRLKIFFQSFQDFSQQYPEQKYDLIISNPPFFLNSSGNPDKQKQLARHTNSLFFNQLLAFAKSHLSLQGACYFILPSDVANYIMQEGLNYQLYKQLIVNIRSSELKQPHRQIIKLGFAESDLETELFTIYQSEKSYSEQYRSALKDFLTIF